MDLSIWRNWLLVGSLVALPVTANATCAPNQGALVFKKCAACHVAEGQGHGVGPNLRGVVGRRPGTARGFNYSPAVRNLDAAWSPAELEQFLLAPQKYAKGTRMAFSGLRNPQERADVICFLQSKR